jgi:outer membrane receptor protein involved in Fe transport
MKKITNFLKKMMLLAVVLLFNQSFAQSGVLSGKVNDNNGVPVIGANVVAGTKATSTNADGSYSISGIPNGTAAVTVSYIGFKTLKKDVQVNGATTMDFTIQEDSSNLEEVVVTGVINPKAKLKSSVSITSLDVKQVEQSAPRSTAEIFRTIPGIRSESSGGEGNANIAVRGVPISSGGSKYLQIQEDGLPVLLFGDIAFATADIFTRFDGNVAKVEAIRGGSASILATNSPGGIINFISKTGKTEGGRVTTGFGMDYNNFRTDFDYGTKIGDGLYFHTGGFYRVGEGVRKTGFTANNGGQFKFNITKEFENGAITVYAKFLNDRAAAYMPMPVQVSGTNANPSWGSISGFDATHGALQSVYLNHNNGLGADGQLRRTAVADGMNPITKSMGVSANFNLDNNWKISENGRFSLNSGGFIAPFPAEVGSAAAIASSFGTGATLTYADNGAPFNNPNGLVSRIHMFDTQLNNLNNFMNDLKVTKKFDNVSITAGYFKSLQNISMSWTWNSYLQEVSDNNPRLINVTSGTGGALSQNGLYAYGVPAWGNCCTRNYDTQYNVSAPYASVSVEVSEKLSLEGGVRFDMGKVSGSFAGSSQVAYDVNNDGVISAPETSVSAINNAAPTAVNYDYNYTSYSFGANYLLSTSQSLFARTSRGASAKADRILFSGLNYMDGNYVNSLDFLTQSEVGFKQKFSKGYLYATLFTANTDEQTGFEATNPTAVVKNNYKSTGLELETAYNVNKDLSLRGALTYTKAEITSGTFTGNEPRRQPKLMYNFIPSYKFSKGKNTLGFSFIGQSKAYAQDENKLVMKGFMLVNGFVDFTLTKGLSLNLSGNNLFNTLAITETEEGSITENTVNYVRARPLPGRSISMAVSYRF